MQELLRQKQKRIDDLQWQVAEAQARLHIYKTRGADEDADLALRSKITSKYYKINYPDECGSDARMAELSDLSDEERATDILPALPREHAEDVAGPLPAVGEIHSVSDPADHTAFCLDDEQGAAAESDLLAGVAEEDRLSGERESAVSRRLAREQLLGKTAIAEPGLRFSYVLLLLQENGRWLPAPIGRFGQPFWRGSSWESFDPRRLYDQGRTDYVTPTSKLYQQLAQDASLIAFAFRSATQRQIVSSALQRGAGFVGSHEPDMVSMCRTNPARLPNAIRRQYRRGAGFYAEYDAADIGNHIALAMSGPQKTQDGVQRRDYQDQKRAWIQAVERCVLDWAPQVAGELAGLEPAELASAVRPWPASVDLANRGVGELHELYRMIWDHLTANGLPPRSLLPGGDCHDYIRRGRVLEGERRRLSEQYREQMGPDHGGNQTDERRWVADRMPYESVPAGFPVVRVRLQKEKVATLAEKYRERRNARAFIPL